MSNPKGYPANQPFNVSPRKCQAKRNSWWSKNPPQNNSNKTAAGVK